ncbi:unnamed protein product [Bursaphelenchus xylophilus]|uniref:(pine wood nematode) hypothetical protein n=1 Tax=Bursaphelenchus xylophilus TaxID=6326 RepID=A0A1I7RSW5_BURXY|nr:unnamed protein product [Bursaphelenchus xylophilus]CAG9122773.1 unnamed protein product [Bursaphelenchus xylophilus]
MSLSSAMLTALRESRGVLMFSLLTVLLISTVTAKPLSQDRRSLQILLRAIDNELESPYSDDLMPSRSRRAVASELPQDKRELLAYDKKSYPRICYFSPIQCLFTRMSLKK